MHAYRFKEDALMMSQSKPNLSLAYTSQLKEMHLDNLPYEGTIPAWLSGSFISNGPAQFEIGNTSFKHWLDGFAMLKKFTFHESKVSFTNKFLRSKQYCHSIENKKLYFNEFATYAHSSWPMRIAHSLRELFHPTIFDNCNVNIANITEHWMAMTESNCQLAFDLETLSTQGIFTFNQALPGQMSLAHPQVDIDSGDMINLTIDIGKKIQYHIYVVTPGSMQQQPIKTYVSDKLYYMHSFCLTKNYIILLKSPLTSNKFKLMLGLPFNHTLTWDKCASSSFVVMNRHNGDICEIETDPFICLHSVNAFERNHELVLDLICYTDGNPYDELYLANLTSDRPELRRSNLRRYIINMPTKSCEYEVLCDKIIEFPNINYDKIHGENYQFAYSAWMTDRNQLFLNAIQKLDVTTGNTLAWRKDHCYPGEPIFIAHPQAKNEDDGLLLFIVLNTQTQCSALVILNAQDMQPMAEVHLPIHLPLGLHGQFYHP